MTAAGKGSILVTGANGGLGGAIARHISTSQELLSFHGLYTVRSMSASHSSGLSAAMASSTDKQHSYETLALDLNTLSGVRQTAKLINERIKAGEIPPIRVLVLNAGFQDFGKQQWLQEDQGGWDVTFATNYLGHWLLALLLLGSMDKERGRIVVIGSQAHDPHDERNNITNAFTTPEYSTFIHDQASIEAIAKGIWSPASEDPSYRSGYRRYGASKLFLIMMMYSLQRRLSQDPSLDKLCVLGVDPGTMATGLQRLASWPIRILLFKILYPLTAWLFPNGTVRTTERSAADVMRAAMDNGPGLGEEPKQVYLNANEPIETSAESRDVIKQDWLWEESVRFTGLTQDETVLTKWR